MQNTCPVYKVWGSFAHQRTPIPRTVSYIGGRGRIAPGTGMWEVSGGGREMYCQPPKNCCRYRTDTNFQSEPPPPSPSKTMGGGGDVLPPPKKTAVAIEPMPIFHQTTATTPCPTPQKNSGGG